MAYSQKSTQYTQSSSVVKDLQHGEGTAESTVTPTDTTESTALDTLKDALNTFARSSGGSEKKNYDPLYALAQDFKNHAKELDLQDGDSQLEVLRDQYQRKAAQRSENYTPSEIKEVFGQVGGDTIEKPIEALQEASANQRIQFNEEARMIGMKKAPEASAEKQVAIGRDVLSTQITMEAIERLVPEWSPKEKEDAIGHTYREVMQKATLNMFETFLDTHGGVITPDLLQAFKSSMTTLLRSKGYNPEAIQKFVDNTLSVWASAAEAAGTDLDKASKYTQNIKDMWMNQNYLNYANTELTIDNNGTPMKTTLGQVIWSVGGNLGSEAGQIFLARHPELISQLASTKTMANFSTLPGNTQDMLMTRNGNAIIKGFFEKGSLGSKTLDILANQGAQEYYKGIKGMSAEQMKSNSLYNTSLNAYVNSHMNADMEGATSADKGMQVAEFRAGAEQAGEDWNTMTKGEGVVLFDKAGEPHYLRPNGRLLYDATNEGSLVEWMDNDAVDVRNKAFGLARQAIIIAANNSDRPVEEIIDVFNESMIKKSDAMKKYVAEFNDGEESQLTTSDIDMVLSKFYAGDVQEYGRFPVYKESDNGKMNMQATYDLFREDGEVDQKYSKVPYVLPVLKGKVEAYDQKNNSLVITTTNGAKVMSPVDATLKTTYMNPFTNITRVVIEDKFTGDEWTFNSKNMRNDYFKPEQDIKRGDVIAKLSSSSKNLGIQVKSPDGTAKNIKHLFGGKAIPEVPDKKPTDVKEVPVPPKKPYEAGYVKNSDGSVSTIRTIHFEEDGKYILIPTVFGDKILSDKDAIDVYHKTGFSFGEFKTSAEAEKAAKKLHEQEESNL